MPATTETNAISIEVPSAAKPKPPATMAANNKDNPMELSNILPASTALDQVSAKEYLQINVFPKLEIALNNVGPAVSPSKTVTLTMLFMWWLSCWRRLRRTGSSRGSS